MSDRVLTVEEIAIKYEIADVGALKDAMEDARAAYYGPAGFETRQPRTSAC